MPKPVFTDDDYENPSAPDGERRLRSDHPLVIDASYTVTRARQRLELWKGSIRTQPLDPLEGVDLDDEHATLGPELSLYIKERSRGRGYLADFEYCEPGWTHTVYGTLVSDGAGVVINELEFWRHGSWSYTDAWGDYVGPDGDHEADDDGDDRQPFIGVTATLLRQVPVGRICALAQTTLAAREWETDGIQVIMGPDIAGDEIDGETRTSLESAAALAEQAPRSAGRPQLPDDLLEAVATAYTQELAGGAGLTRRLAERFCRPEPTVRDWITKARARGYLSAAVPGRRGGQTLQRRTSGLESGT